MFTDRTQVEHVPSVANGLESLRHKISRAIEDQKNSGFTLYEFKGLRKPEQVDEG